MRDVLTGERASIHVTAALWLGAALIYGLVGWFCLAMTSATPTFDAVPFWLPSGFAVAFVYRQGLAAAVAFLIPAWILALHAGTIPFDAAVVALALTLEPVASVWLIRRVQGDQEPLIGSRPFAQWLLIAALAGPLLRASLNIAIGVPTPEAFTLAAVAAELLDHGLSSAIGVLILAPLVLCWRGWSKVQLSLRDWWRLSGIMLALMLVTTLAFGAWPMPDSNYPLAFLPLPILMGLAFGYGIRFAGIGVPLAIFLAWWFTAQGQGPFASLQPLEAKVLLESFALVNAAATLMLAAVADELRQSKESYRLAGTVFQDSNEAIAISDASGGIVQSNPALRVLTGLTSDELAQRNVDSLIYDQSDAEARQGLWVTLRQTGVWKGEITHRDAKGVSRPLACSLTAFTNQMGYVTNYITFLQDLSEHELSQAQIYKLAHYDALTGLPNRTLFYDHLEQALGLARRHQKKVAVVFLDLDEFKGINDSLGHDAGDQVLQDIGRRLRRQVRETDTLARWGGDEFTLLLTEITQSQQVVTVIQSMLSSLHAPIRIDDQSFVFEASAGIALYPNDGKDANTLIRNADAAMYSAKAKGRGQYCFYSSAMNAKTLKRLAMQKDLQKALENDEFRVYFQPQVRLTDGCIVGSEALVRWERPGQGLVAPSEFIPLAEDTGQIVALGQLILEKACQSAALWQQRGAGRYSVSVNLSPKQFQSGQLVESVKRVLALSGLPPGSLVLEITESHLMQGGTASLEVLRALRRIGVRFYIDDFGTGYSSLGQLKRLPVDGLKLDKSFVMDLAKDQDAPAIVWTIIEVGRHLGLEVVAEGVESLSQLEYLVGHSCTYAQGYYFSRPIAADAMDTLLKQGGRLPATAANQ
ncbi:MAG: EAL domain-containing protein [Pseudomonadota bacterium]